MILRKIAFLLVIFLTINLSVFSDVDYGNDLELWRHIQRTGESGYKMYIRKNGGQMKDYKNWDSVVRKTFQRLVQFSGKKPFPLRYAIVNNSDFNAFSFPGGQFIIYKGTLEQIDNYITKIKNEKKGNCTYCRYKLFKKGQSFNKNIFREGLLAAILAHELSHYYNQHSFKSIKKILKLRSDKNQIKRELKKVSYGQEDELEADVFGLILLQKANYNTDWMVVVLKILNDIRQQSLTSNTEQIPFFESHPTPHKRLAQLDNQNQNFHKWAAQMEIAFANIQFGRNLTEARKVIKKSIIKYKDNVEFLKAYAICLHKIWERSASLNDLKLKAIINIPTYRDDMLFSGGSKGSKKTPGNIIAYNRAKRAYKKALRNSVEPYFLSNYSVLLSYSSKKRDIKKAIQIAERIHKECEKIQELTIQLENNLGVVYYLSAIPKYRKESLKHFQSLSANLDENLIALYKSNEKEIQEYAKGLMSSIYKKQTLDPTYVNEDFTPILNLALIENDLKHKNVARKLSKHYLYDYDSRSEWAVHLGRISNIKPPKGKTPKSHFFVNGIKIGNSIKDLIKKWGRADNIEVVGTTEIWYYDKLNSEILIKDGLIAEIFLNGEESPKINNRLGIGLGRAIVESVLGKKFNREAHYYNYYQNGKAAVKYINNTAKQIILYE